MLVVLGLFVFVWVCLLLLLLGWLFGWCWCGCCGDLGFVFGWWVMLLVFFSLRHVLRFVVVVGFVGGLLVCLLLVVYVL